MMLNEKDLNDILDGLKLDIMKSAGAPSLLYLNRDDMTATEALVEGDTMADKKTENSIVKKIKSGETYLLTDDDFETSYVFYLNEGFFKQTVDWTIFKKASYNKALKHEKIGEPKVRELITDLVESKKAIESLKSSIVNPPSILP